ncbi:YegP family protein [Flavivirga amylovorans]|uniref:YegP family protein n=1 Tax=Flavivirga amylovorans TaxID=870486 RepID=A0ABT8X073_9FLAO|nr:YegP family protein [Flavivirga amylovorans]MDO5987113.1 YegP family protein [Flavivirga amylovorans]
MGQPKFEIKNSTNEKFYFNLKAGNGEPILTSQMYASKQGCENGITSVKVYAPEDSSYEKKVASNDKYFFILKAKNGETIAKSEMYNSTQARDHGIVSVKTNAPIAETYDLTAV